MLNRIILMGRLTRDPRTASHRQRHRGCFPSSSLWSGTSATRPAGQKTTDFIDIVAWRQTGEFVSKYFTKGRMAVVEGLLQMRDWQDRDGNKRRSAEVVADNVYFADSRRDGEQSGGYAPASSGYAPAPSSYAPPRTRVPRR